MKKETLKVSSYNEKTVIVLGDTLKSQLDLECFTVIPEGDSELYKTLAVVAYLENMDLDVEIRKKEKGKVLKFIFNSGRKFFISRNNSNRQEINLKVVAQERWDVMIPDGLVLELTFSMGGDVQKKAFIEKLKNKVTENRELAKTIEGMSVEEMKRRLLELEGEKKKEEQRKEAVKTKLNQFKKLLKKDISLNDFFRSMSEEGEAEGTIVESRNSLGVERLSNYGNRIIGGIVTNGVGIKVSGYYRMNVDDDYILTNGGEVRGVFRGGWEPLLGVREVPSEWEIFTTTNVGNNWVDVPIKNGMTDATYIEKEGLEVIVDRENRVIRARTTEKGNVGGIRLFQRQCEYGIFSQKSRPEGINYRVDCKIGDINGSLASKLREIKESNLSDEEARMRINMLHWETFVFDDNPEIEEEVMRGVETMADFERNLVNAGRGICNYSAARLSIMLRLCGFPTKVESGVVTSTKVLDQKNSHAWVLTWGKKGKRQEIESTSGVISNLERTGMEISFNDIGDMVIMDRQGMADVFREKYSPEMVAKILYSVIMRQIKEKVLSIRNIPKTTMSLKRSIKDLDLNQIIKEVTTSGIILASDAAADVLKEISEKQRRKLAKLRERN